MLSKLDIVASIVELDDSKYNHYFAVLSILKTIYEGSLDYDSLLDAIAVCYLGEDVGYRDE